MFTFTLMMVTWLRQLYRADCSNDVILSAAAFIQLSYRWWRDDADEGSPSSSLSYLKTFPQPRGSAEEASWIQRFELREVKTHKSAHILSLCVSKVKRHSFCFWENITSVWHSNHWPGLIGFMSAPLSHGIIRRTGTRRTGLWVKHAEELRCRLTVIMLFEKVQ